MLFDCAGRSIQVALPDRRVPSGEPLGQGGSPASAIPYGTERWRALYRPPRRTSSGSSATSSTAGHSRSLRRRITRVRLHTDLTILARLTCALAAASSPAGRVEPGRLQPAECGHLATPDR